MASDCGGWGQYWGQIPWGGSVCPPEGPTGGWSGGARYERVRREREERLERKEIRNVLFKVDGVEALSHIGKVQITAGYGRAVQLRHFRAGHSAVGAVQIFLEITAPALVRHGISQLGGAQVDVIYEANVDGLRADSAVGRPAITAQRNMTDDEFIHLLAEML